MAGSRVLPIPGAVARIHHLAHVEEVTIVRVEGTTVEVQTAAGDTLAFGLHRLTGHFYLDGGPTTGPRLQLEPAAAPDPLV